MGNDLSSDHIPILISIKRNVVSVNAAKRTYDNYSKANWARLKEHLEEEIGRLPEPQDIHIGETKFSHRSS